MGGEWYLRGNEVDAYLRRIRYRGSRTPDLETLRALHLAHLHAVPFENLDVGLGRPSILDPGRLFDKVVNQGRGGICHELNALFYGLLSALGFDVEMLSGRVYGRRNTLGPELEHMLLKVDLDRRWIADVGFGETFRQPLLLDARGEQKDGVRRFFLGHEEGERALWMRRPRGAWTPQYRFTLQPRSLDEYAAACELRLSSPGSFFSKNLMCSMATPNGRVTLLNDRLIVTWNGLKQERRLWGDQDFRAELSRRFGIVLPDDLPIRRDRRRSRAG
jgi:N-hydroxyarylamine O-acetyltransferase